MAAEDARYIKASLFKGLHIDAAHTETLAIIEDVDQFTDILASMRESKLGRVIGLDAAFADLL
jgi:hypothetical protein